MIPKFRVWDKYNQNMFANDELIIWNNNVYANDSKKLSCNYLKGWSIDEEYLMQSTGLFDENGVEIFEGDILRVSDEHSWLEVVSYNQEKAMFVTEEINREFKVPETPLYDLFNTNIFKFEIIGNIYENPELLEVEE